MLFRRTTHNTDLLFRLATVHEHACQTILVDTRTWKWAMKKWPFRNGKVSAMEAPLRIRVSKTFYRLLILFLAALCFAGDPYRRRSLVFLTTARDMVFGLIDKVFYYSWFSWFPIVKQTACIAIRFYR